MNWYKLISHDIRFGLIRKRIILAILQFVLIGLSYWSRTKRAVLGTFGCDYLINIFSGIKPISNTEEFIMPIIWLQVMCCPLYMYLSYPHDDLIDFGQQAFIRSDKRIRWYISKCIWNVISSIFYFATAVVVSFVLSLFLHEDTTLNFRIYSVVEHGVQMIYQIKITGIVEIFFAPLLTIVALHMLQMTLSFFIKEIYAFICCISFLILAVYVPSALVLGNGAMIIRSGLEGVGVSIVSTYTTVAVSLVTVALSIIVGSVRFKQFDILSVEC